MSDLNLSYSNLSSLISSYSDSLSESGSFLAWFLENLFRLDEIEIQDCICDGPGDKGIDGIYVDDNINTIFVFQCKVSRNVKSTIGDSSLKNFFGTLNYFDSKNNIEQLLNSSPNPMLVSAINRFELQSKITEGYDVKGIFVTNMPSDKSASDFLNSQDKIELYDNHKIINSYVPAHINGPADNEFSFDITGYNYIDHIVDNNIRVLICPISSIDLARLNGIQDQSLFFWNVRQSLGRTKVNKDIETNIHKNSEHRYFLLYHNGITIICNNISTATKNQIKIRKYAVVNGCQSLTTIFNNYKFLSDDLRIFTKFIQIPPDNELAKKITYISNNQNGIKPRDLKSTSKIQVRLQNEFDLKYKDRYFYEIKRGEAPEIEHKIDNVLAARILLAFDLKEPWTCHQTYKLFDELHSRIFGRPTVNAGRIIALYLIYEAIIEMMKKIDNPSLRAYTLARFFLMYVIREILESDIKGTEFCDNPEPFIKNKKKEQRFVRSIKLILGDVDVIVDLNSEIKEKVESEEYYDYKTELKSPSKVRELKTKIVNNYKKLVSRKRISSFSQELEKL